MGKTQLTCFLTKDEYYNNILTALQNIKSAKRSKTFVKDLVENLIGFKMAELGLKEFSYQFDKGYFICNYSANCIFINDKLQKFNLSNVVKLIDGVFHEFEHVKADIVNATIKKDENGNTNKKYLPNFYEQTVYATLCKVCEMDKEDASKLSFALYCNNENEKLANNNAFEQSIKLLQSSKTDKNAKLVDKMIKLETKSFNESVKTAYSKENINLINEFNAFKKKHLINFQYIFAQHPSNSPTDILQMYVARMLCPNFHADQELFEYFLTAGNVDACVKILNMPNFKNTPDNLRDVINLLHSKKRSLLCLTGIEEQAILKYAKAKPAVEELTIDVKFKTDDYGLN